MRELLTEWRNFLLQEQQSLDKRASKRRIKKALIKEVGESFASERNKKAVGTGAGQAWYRAKPKEDINIGKNFTSAATKSLSADRGVLLSGALKSADSYKDAAVSKSASSTILKNTVVDPLVYRPLKNGLVKAGMNAGMSDATAEGTAGVLQKTIIEPIVKKTAPYEFAKGLIDSSIELVLQHIGETPYLGKLLRFAASELAGCVISMFIDFYNITEAWYQTQEYLASNFNQKIQGMAVARVMEQFFESFYTKKATMSAMGDGEGQPRTLDGDGREILATTEAEVNKKATWDYWVKWEVDFMQDWQKKFYEWLKNNFFTTDINKLGFTKTQLAFAKKWQEEKKLPDNWERELLYAKLFDEKAKDLQNYHEINVRGQVSGTPEGYKKWENPYPNEDFKAIRDKYLANPDKNSFYRNPWRTERGDKLRSGEATINPFKKELKQGRKGGYKGILDMAGETYDEAVSKTFEFAGDVISAFNMQGDSRPIETVFDPAKANLSEMLKFLEGDNSKIIINGAQRDIPQIAPRSVAYYGFRTNLSNNTEKLSQALIDVSNLTVAAELPESFSYPPDLYPYTFKFLRENLPQELVGIDNWITTKTSPENYKNYIKLILQKMENSIQQKIKGYDQLISIAEKYCPSAINMDSGSGFVEFVGIAGQGSQTLDMVKQRCIIQKVSAYANPRANQKLTQLQSLVKAFDQKNIQQINYIQSQVSLPTISAEYSKPKDVGMAADVPINQGSDKGFGVKKLVRTVGGKTPIQKKEMNENKKIKKIILQEIYKILDKSNINGG